MAQFDMSESEAVRNSYASLPNMAENSRVKQNITPIKANFIASEKEVAGCHPSRWVYELINNRFTVCDLFDRARIQSADFDSPYAWEHAHTLVINGNQTCSTPFTQLLSSICLDCHFHFVFKMSWQGGDTSTLCHYTEAGWPLKDDMFPWHHFAWAGSDSPGSIASDHSKYNPILAREIFFCTAPPCTYQLTLEVSEPRMHTWWVNLLLDKEAIRKQLQIFKELEPTRFEDATDEWATQAPANLNTYLKNLLESTAENARSISKRNKRFSVLFGPRCFSIFRELEFQEKVDQVNGYDEGFFTPQPAAPPCGPSGTTEINTYRAYLEDVRAEVQCLIHKAGQVSEKPTFCAPMLHNMLQCTEVGDVKSNALVSADRYRLIGVLPTQEREIVVNAYKRQWDLLPSSRKELIDALLNIANDTQDDFLIEYAVTQSSVYESQTRQQVVGGRKLTFAEDPIIRQGNDDVYSQPLAYLGLDPSNNYTADSIIQAFRRKLAEDASAASMARNILMAIASESQDDHYQASLLMEADPKMSLETAMYVIGLDGSEDVVSTAEAATRKKLGECQNLEARKLFLDALDSIAEHTGSLSLKQAAAELTHESESITGMRSANYDAPVDFSLPVGLDNIGNTCYLNSLLQYLFTIKPVRDVVFDYDELKLGLAEEDIEKRRIGGNKMQLDRGEAVVADAFARELAILFENLQNSKKAATRPSQRLANAVLLSTHTLLNSEKQSDRQNSPLPPPLPTRPPPDTVSAADGSSDVAMTGFGDQVTGIVETVSLSSTMTLVEERDNAGPKYERIQKAPVVNEKSTSMTANADGDAEMSDSNNGPGKAEENVQANPAASSVDLKTLDTDMAEAEVPETIDQKVLNALERQKRSSGTDQQDVEEVMGSIINRLQAAIRPSSIDGETGIQLESLMKTFFVTTVNYTKKFDEQKYQNEISFDRSITAFPAENGPCTLYDALGRNFDQQILEDSKLSRYTTIRTLPPILHVLIQRTQSTGSKNGNPVIIPETLHLDRFMDKEHDSPAFHRRVEDWITAKRIADIKTDLASIEENPSYLKALENNLPPAPTPAQGKMAVHEESTDELDVFDFDGPVDDDFVMVPPSEPATNTVPTSFPKVAGIYETYCQVRQMMQEELQRCEKTLAMHNDELKQISYRLHAVICHRGQLMSGHYWVWIHDFEDNVWRWYNDADVRESKNTEEVLRTLSTSGEPYFLCYVRDTDKDEFVNVPKRASPHQLESSPDTKSMGEVVAAAEEPTGAAPENQMHDTMTDY